MGLAVEPVSTQVIPRDRHAAFFAALGVVASSVERLAVEIRHLQRTEVLEAEEPFDPGQKGSSAMPHKRNPILTENLTGLARLVRSAVVPAMENVALWHERDISHSSVERGIGPDATIHLDFALHRLAGVVERLQVYPENMQKNLDRLGGLVHSQRVMLALTQAGVSREDAYAAVQENAMKVWRGEGRFLDFLKDDARVTLADAAARGPVRPRLPHQEHRHGVRPRVRRLIKRAFDPVVDAQTRLLILGSLPGEASLAAGQYYAHPRNAFWRLMDGVTGRDISSLPYEDRLVALQAIGIGLWDVIASAERSGSLDSAIRSPEAADLRGLIARLPCIACCGLQRRQGGATGSENSRVRSRSDFPDYPALLQSGACPVAGDEVRRLGDPDVASPAVSDDLRSHVAPENVIAEASFRALRRL